MIESVLNEVGGKKILIACEESAVVREAFRVKGYNAWSCDLLPSRIEGNHFQCDVREILGLGWDLMIAHPPCTRLANSGVQWLQKRNLWDEMIESVELFRTIMDAPIPKIAIENPIMHKYALALIGRKYDQIIQPWQFGHGESKATCLWLKNLPVLKPTNIVTGREQRIWKMPPGESRARERSVTYTGIAGAFVDQWGGI